MTITTIIDIRRCLCPEYGDNLSVDWKFRKPTCMIWRQYYLGKISSQFVWFDDNVRSFHNLYELTRLHREDSFTVCMSVWQCYLEKIPPQFITFDDNVVIYCQWHRWCSPDNTVVCRWSWHPSSKGILTVDVRGMIQKDEV